MITPFIANIISRKDGPICSYDLLGLRPMLNCFAETNRSKHFFAVSWRVYGKVVDRAFVSLDEALM
jgi:hypothetical protein